VKIIVIGGYGDIGSYVVEKLVENSTHQVTIAGRNLKKARSLCSTFKGHIGALYVDVDEKATLTGALGNFDLVINCAGPFYKYGANVATAAIETKTHYIDICDDADPLPKLFALDAAAKRAGVTVLTGMGWNPGISNLAARLGANLLDAVDEIKIAWVAGSGDAEGKAALAHVLHGITGQVPAFRDGKQVTAPAWTEMELVEFPAPLGELPEFLFGHPEPVTLPQALSAKKIEVRGGINPSWNNNALRFIRSLGLTSSPGTIDTTAGLIHRVQKLFSIGGVKHSALRVDVIGRKAKQERHLVFNMLDRIRPLTGTPCALGALMLLEGAINRRGVVAPEMCIDPVKFFDRLSDEGIKILREGRL
jgi:saccharopine dehydrogenase-like NADP-dependent oxidoreductase